MGHKRPICNTTYPASCIPVGFNVVMGGLNGETESHAEDRKGATVTKSQHDHQNDAQNTQRPDTVLYPFIWDRYSVWNKLSRPRAALHTDRINRDRG